MSKPVNEMTFIERVKKHFGSLEGNFDVRLQMDGVVEYASDTTVIVIDSETGYVGVQKFSVS